MPSILLAGLIPFAVIFIELLFVFQSMWQDKSAGYYYVFGFLFLVTIMLLTTAEVTVVTIYITLCNENYQTTSGGGTALQSAAPALSGCGCIACGITSSSCTFRGL
jgi:hypothetical protein